MSELTLALCAIEEDWIGGEFEQTRGRLSYTVRNFANESHLTSLRALMKHWGLRLEPSGLLEALVFHFNFYIA